MSAVQSSVRQRLEPNSGIFHGALFCLGLGMGTDMLQASHNTWQSNAMVGLPVVVVIAALFWLERTRKIRPSTGIFISFMIAFLSFSSSMLINDFFQPEHPQALMARAQFPLMLVIFAAVSSMAIDRRMGMVFGLICLGVEVWYSLAFRNSDFYRSHLALTIPLLLIGLGMLWHYRGRLERLVEQVDQRLKDLQSLHAKAEDHNERNQSFANFGRNTGGLVSDFEKEIAQVAEDLLRLRQIGAAGDPALEAPLVLKRMRQSLRGLERRVDLVRILTSAQPDKADEIFELGPLVEAGIYPFQLNPRWRDTVQFHVDCPGGLVTCGSRLPILKALDGLVNASLACGATMISVGLAPALPGQLDLEYTDNGATGDEFGGELKAALQAVPELSGQYRIFPVAAGVVVRFRAGIQLEAVPS